MTMEQTELLKQALNVAVDALKDNLSEANFREMPDASRFHCIRTKCEFALDQIKQITESPAENVQKKMTPEELDELKLLVNATFK